MNTFPWKIEDGVVEVSGFEGRVSMSFPSLITQPHLADRMKEFEAAYPNVPLIQESVLGQLSVEEREFLISGTTPERWKEMFGEDR